MKTLPANRGSAPIAAHIQADDITTPARIHRSRNLVLLIANPRETQLEGECDSRTRQLARDFFRLPHLRVLVRRVQHFDEHVRFRRLDRHDWRLLRAASRQATRADRASRLLGAEEGPTEESD